MILHSLEILHSLATRLSRVPRDPPHQFSLLHHHLPPFLFFSEPRERERIIVRPSRLVAHTLHRHPTKPCSNRLFIYLFYFFFIFLFYIYILFFFCVTLEPRNYACRCYHIIYIYMYIASSSYARSLLFIFLFIIIISFFFISLLHTCILYAVRRARFPGRKCIHPSASFPFHRCHCFRQCFLSFFLFFFFLSP